MRVRLQKPTIRNKLGDLRPAIHFNWCSGVYFTLLDPISKVIVSFFVSTELKSSDFRSIFEFRLLSFLLSLKRWRIVQCLAIINHLLGYNLHFLQYGVETLLTVRVIAVFQTKSSVMYTRCYGLGASFPLISALELAFRHERCSFFLRIILEVQSADFRKFETQYS